MVEGIACYAQYTSRKLIIPCKADDSSLFIGEPDEIYKKAPSIVIQFEVIFFFVMRSKLKETLYY